MNSQFVKRESVQISVVIVSYNTRSLTLECLTKLYDSLESLPAEIFVVDNGSSDGSAAEIADAFPDVHLIRNSQNLGFGAANNQGMKRANREFILLLNSDAFPESGAIPALIDYLKQHPRSAVVGPRLLNRDGSLQRSCYQPASPWRATCDQLLLSAAMPGSSLFGDYRNWAHDQDRQVAMVIGACMLVRRSAIDQVGMFDEDFFLYSEEADWCRRFGKAGWSIDFTPVAQVVHLNGASGKAQSDRVFTEFHRGQERLVRKHSGKAGLAWYRLMVICGALIRVTLFAVAGFVISRKRADFHFMTLKWLRLFWWTIGHRGPGLSELQASIPASKAVVCV